MQGVLAGDSVATRAARLREEACEQYAAGVDASDYVPRMAPVVRSFARPVGDLLDVGAGGGQLGAAVREPGCRWTAIEPSAPMVRRLKALPDPPSVLACGWREAKVEEGGHDTVLACNMPAFLDDARAFLAQCLRWTRRSVVWGVGAHRAASGVILAALLPPEWHGEDERPTLDKVLDQLAPSGRPHRTETVDWTYSVTTDDLFALALHLARRIGWSEDDARLPELFARLQAQARPDPAGWRLSVPRRTALLLWRP